MRGTGKLAMLALGLMMVVSSLPAAISSGDGGPGRASARDAWITTDTLETTVEVRNAGRFFFSAGPDSRIKEMALPDAFAGMPPELVSAVDRAPQWLREDLAKKLRELAMEDIRAAVTAPGDYDRDGDSDLFCYDRAGTLTFYENLGTRWSPLFMARSGENLSFPVDGLGASAGDLNGDGWPDLVAGDALGHMFVALNPGSATVTVARWTVQNLTASVISYAFPALADLDADGDQDLVVGDGPGKIQYFENTGNRTRWNFQKTPSSAAFAPLAVPGPAAPELADLDGDGKLDLTAGGGNGVFHYFQNIGTARMPAWAPDDLFMYSGIEFPNTNAVPGLADLNGDNRTDLIDGQGFIGPGRAFYFVNIGTSTDPQWPTWPFYSAATTVGYYPVFQALRQAGFGGMPAEYARALNAIEPRCVDELAFSMAHSAVEAMRASSPELYIENARSIYKNDETLDYVQVVDYPDYSTTKYRVNESGRISTYELPRDIYYWYIVHPKITDDIPLYIDPNEASGSPNQSKPPPVGKFWRDWLLFNADPAYPPDPVNATAHYPKTMAPPLLADLLDGVTTLWNRTRYSSPGGFDDEGINNSHAADYGDHAIEKISYWVMKTLPMNEQESADGERPVQPVRIARGHNGNCGELGDLTVAAARACLIPAVQVSMQAEDHVWIQFYERGWHQWDNYWSDGGAVIDDFMNYWIGWGHRGGSGISGWRGDDYPFEVTDNYIPPVSQSHVTVNVKDSAGYPVDGARVVMMSHWMAEQQALPMGITFPFPAVWNFTDCEGNATFVLARQNFTIDIVSKLGHTALNKTYIGEGQELTFDFTLPGRLPSPVPNLSSSPNRPPGKLQLEFNFSVERGEQRPPNPEVMTTSVQPVNSGLRLGSFICDDANFTRYLSGQIFFGEVYVRVYEDFTWPSLVANLTGSGTWYLVLFNENTLETSKTVHVRLVLSVLHETPGVVIDYPVEGSAVDGARPVPVTGRILGGAPAASLELSVDGGIRQNITAGLERASGLWRWETDLTALPSGRHTLEAVVTDTLGYVNRTSASITLDKLPPRVFIDSPAAGTIFGLDTLVEFDGRATDDTALSGLSYRMDDLPAQALSVGPSGGEWNFSHPGGTLLGGKHTVEVRAIDIVGRSGNATLGFELRDERPPEVAITAPAAGTAFELGAPVILEGTARDDSRLESLSLAVGGRTVDLLPTLDGDGRWKFSWYGSGRTDTGEVSFTVTAQDDSGNRASASGRFVLTDTRAPTVELSQPVNGTVFRIGDPVNISGTCTDGVGVVRLQARLGVGAWRTITGSLRDGKYRYLLETDGLPIGKYNITVRAHDGAGNTATTSGFINLEKQPAATPKPASGSFIPSAGGAGALAAVALLAAAGRLLRRGMED